VTVGFLTEAFAVGGGGPTTLPVFGEAGSRYGNASAAPPIPVPGNVVNGSFIIIVAYVDGNITITPPSGFLHHPLSPGGINIGGIEQHKLALMYKFATGADSGSYTLSLSSSVFVYARALRYSNVNTSTPWDGGQYVDGGATATTTTPAVSMTPAGPNRKVLHVATDWNGDGGTWGIASGFSQREGGAGVTNVMLEDKDFAVAAATGSISVAQGNGHAGALITGLVGV
jgi:hypothetical protein